MYNYRTNFLSRATGVHGEKYDYSKLPEAFTYKTWVPIICKIHGLFEQKATSHAEGSGCPHCAQDIRRTTIYNRNRHTKEQFVQKAQAVHGTYYDYTETEYVGQMKSLLVRCPKHGQFKVVANNHVHGTGCAACKRSRGETMIENWLMAHRVTYETQKSYADLVMPDVKKLTNRPKYDFYLPDHNLIIEYDGKQHFEPVRFRGVCQEEAVRLHERTVLGDLVKDAYAIKNGLKMLRISYKDANNIEAILTQAVIT